MIGYLDLAHMTWADLKNVRGYNLVTGEWQDGPADWEMLSHNRWNGESGGVTLQINTEASGTSVVRVKQIAPEILQLYTDIIGVQGSTQWGQLIYDLLPWYLRESDIIKNTCYAIGAMLSVLETRVIITRNAASLDTTIATLSAQESELGIRRGDLSLDQRRDNIRRVRVMMNDNVHRNPSNLYYLPYIGKWSEAGAAVRSDGSIVDKDNANKSEVADVLTRLSNAAQALHITEG